MTPTPRLKELMEKAICFRDTFCVWWPELQHTEVLRIQQFRGGDQEQCFAVEKAQRGDKDIQIMAFVFQGNVYVTPVSQEDINVMSENMFTRSNHLIVPFTHEEIPVDKSVRAAWLKLFREA